MSRHRKNQIVSSLSILTAMGLVSTGLLAANATTTLDVAGVTFNFNKVLPFASGVAATRALPDVNYATTQNIADLSNPGQIDGENLANGDLVLVKDQTDQSENGIYVVTGGALVRISDYDQTGEVLQGDHVFVDDGNANLHTGWIQQTASVTVGTSNIVWQQGLTQLDGDTHSDIGEDIPVGTQVNYLDVASGGIDARITYLGHYGVATGPSALGVLNKLDDADPAAGANNYVRPSIAWNPTLNSEDKYAEFKIEFFQNIETTPVAITLENLELSIYDVDNAQPVEISGQPAYELATETLLSVTKLGSDSLKVTSLDQNSTEDLTGQPADTPSSYSQGRVSFAFADISSFNIKLGLPKSEPDTNSSFELDFGPGLSWGSRAIDTPAATTFANAPLPNVPVVPYTGPVLSEFSSRTLDPCTPKSITITGTRLSGVIASVQGKSVTVLENTDTKLVLAFPAGLTPGSGVDLDILSSSGKLTFQDAFDIPATTCAVEVSKGRWTQLQPDGKTVKMYAKDPIGDGKIQFFVDGEEIAWINAIDEADPKLSFASSYPYLVRSVELHPGKNRFEIRVDGVRVWRATYVPKS